MVPAQGAAVPWWYSKELQGVRKLAEQQALTLKNMEMEMRGLQRRITQTTHNLTQRVEVLETTTPPVAGECHNAFLSRSLDAMAVSITDLESRFDECLKSRSLDAMAVSITDLESRFECFKADTTARMEASSAVFEEFRGQADSKLKGSKDDVQITFSDASNHMMRHGANLNSRPQEKASPRPLRLPWEGTRFVAKTPEFGSIVLPFPRHKESIVLQNSSNCNAHARVMELLSTTTPSCKSSNILATDTCSTDASGSIDTNLPSVSSFSSNSSKGSSDGEDSATSRLHEVMSHMIQQVVHGEQSVSDPPSKDLFQLDIPQPRPLNVPVVVWTTPLSPLPRPCLMPPPEVQPDSPTLWWLGAGVQASDSGETTASAAS
mmetsp:Transcript_76287/g.150871  ORF Transcript_76287/g.150871 Transcript_76287/m.150871 type:complete len:377 (+) Transcript_76287:12-1142(+)